MSLEGEIDMEINAEIQKRESSGKKIGALLKRELPEGLSFEEFIMRPEVEEFGLDFVRCSVAYDAYRGKEV